jgi:hypothetical protein
MHRFRALCLILLFAASSAAQTKPAAPNPIAKLSAPPTSSDSPASGRLPVKRVVLYKNGIGYFEHTARVHGTQELNIDFTTGQLNDVLKSLTVVDLGEGRIGSVRYNSIAPLEERLRSLRLPFGEQVGGADYLLALRGARVEARSGSGSATGRLLSVERERSRMARATTPTSPPSPWSPTPEICATSNSDPRLPSASPSATSPTRSAAI